MTDVPRLLGFASVVEVTTGLALVFLPHLVAGLLLGVSLGIDGAALARFLGIALLALGVSWWPGKSPAAARTPVMWGMLLYNVLVAIFLAALSVLQGMHGTLLWPAAALHATVAMLLAWHMKRLSH